MSPPRGTPGPDGAVAPESPDAPALTKAEARARAYGALHEAHAARFPFAIEGRIPNFRGAEAAARRLREHERYRRARALKVNPDSPQLPVRVMAMEDGKTLYLPTPRLRGAFLRIRPGDVPPGEFREAARLSTRGRYGQEVSLAEIAAAGDIDLVVTGAVAVTERGARAGKGEGYGDIEYAILRELGHPEIPVVTTVHPAQIVPSLAVAPHDISVDLIVTPDRVIETHTPHAKPQAIDWALLPEDAIEEMPVLRELRRLHWERQTLPPVLVPGLAVVFVGLNPGRSSAAAGHHFAGGGNHFWRLLHEAGFTPRRFAPEEDFGLPALGVGVTNVVDRPSRGEQDLSWEELQAGGEALRGRISACRPRLVVLLGKQVYRAYAALPRSSTVEWGLQPRETVSGVREWAAPNPSPRSTVPYAERLEQFRGVRRRVVEAER